MLAFVHDLRGRILEALGHPREAGEAYRKAADCYGRT